MKTELKIRKVYNYHHKVESSKDKAHQPPRGHSRGHSPPPVNPLFHLADHAQSYFFSTEAFGGRK